MKILVCISNVPDTTSKINFTQDLTAFDTTGVQFVINPNDEFGLTRAMWFKEKQGATVHVATVGSTSVEPTIRKALAIGADEGIRIDAEPEDGLFVARQLAEVVKNGGYDLVIAGRESIDYNGGMVPGMMAAMLDRAIPNPRLWPTASVAATKGDCLEAHTSQRQMMMQLTMISGT